MNVVCNLLRSHLCSSPNPDSPNFTRKSLLVGIFFFFLVFLGLVGICWFTDLTVAVDTLNCSSEDDFKEGDNQAEDQPDVNHLHVRGGGQLLYLAGEDGGHHQHDGQVHSNGIAKQVFVKEDGDKGDEEQEDGGEVGGQQLCSNLPLQLHGHVHNITIWVVFQFKFSDCEHGQLSVPFVEVFKFPRQIILVQYQNLCKTVFLNACSKT